MNAMVLKSALPETGLLSPRRTVNAYLTEIRFEFMRMLRNPALAIPVMALPVALYLLFTTLWGDAITKDPDVGRFMFVAFGVMGVTMPALFSISASLATEREAGLLRLKRAQPAPPASWLVAKITCGLVFCSLAYLPMLAAAILTGKVILTAGQLVGISVALLAGSIPFCALGLMVGSLFKGSAAPGYANLIYLPGLYLSGMFFPLPASMHWQAPIWPQFHVIQLAMHAGGIAKFQFIPVPMAIVTLVGFTVLFSAVAIWRLARKG